MSRTFGLLLSLFVYTGCPPIVLNETDDMNSTMADMASQEFDVLANLECTPSAYNSPNTRTKPSSLQPGVKLALVGKTSITLSVDPMNNFCGFGTLEQSSAKLTCRVPPEALSGFKDTSTYDVIIDQTARLPVYSVYGDGIAAAAASLSLTLKEGTKEVFVLRAGPSPIGSLGVLGASEPTITTSTSTQTPAIALSALSLGVNFEAYTMCNTGTSINVTPTLFKWDVTKFRLKARPH